MAYPQKCQNVDGKEEGKSLLSEKNPLKYIQYKCFHCNKHGHRSPPEPV